MEGMTMDIVTIDTETYYDKEYSLSKMTTEAYVRDPRFEVIGVGVKINNYPTDWYSGDNPAVFLRSFDYSNAAILCHNTAFDGAILSWHYGIKPKLWLDTLSMARPLHNVTVGGSLKALAEHYGLGVKGDEVIHALGKRRQDFTPQDLAQYGAYCCNDVDMTYALFKRMAKNFPSSELMLIDTILRMYTEPMFRIDSERLITHLEAVRNRKSNLVEAMGLNCSEDEAKDTLMSNPKFADYLQTLGVEPPTKVSARTGKTAWAFSKTDLAFTKLLEHENEHVANAVAARLGVKSTLEETRTEALLGVATRGPLPIMLRYYGAHTGRLSGDGGINLQNLPRGSALRRSLCAPKGYKLIACDSSQIEARMVAYISGQDDLVEAFRQKRDVYSEFATEVYGRKITKADTVERFVGKTCVLGLGYGLGAVKFRRALELGQGGIKVIVDEQEATRIVRLYREKNFKITQLWRACDHALAGMTTSESNVFARVAEYTPEGIVLPNRLMIKYAALRRSTDGFAYIADARSYKRYIAGAADGIEWTKLYGAKTVENLTQALARIVITDQMLLIRQRYKIVLQVHDEIVCMVPEDEVEEAKEFIVRVMSTPPAWAPDLPVACEAGVGDNYADAK